jgi:hypothetical protein
VRSQGSGVFANAQESLANSFLNLSTAGVVNLKCEREREKRLLKVSRLRYKYHNSNVLLPRMKHGLLGKFTYHSAILLACFTLGARPQQPVLLTPGENDLVVLNGCVVSACNYLAAVKTQHSLEDNFWARILLVRYNGHPAGHAYCVWETDGTIYGYDRNAGSFPIPVYTRDARAISIVLAQELSKVLNENLAVDRAEFVESGKSEVYKY